MTWPYRAARNDRVGMTRASYISDNTPRVVEFVLYASPLFEHSGKKSKEVDMAANRELNSTDAKRVLRRYWWILPISTVLLTMISWVAANVLPKRYPSQTMVLVEEPSVPSKYVEPVGTDDLNHRLATMQEQILSRSRLQPIIEKLNLYPEDRGRVHIDDLVERLRGAITVKPVESMKGT